MKFLRQPGEAPFDPKSNIEEKASRLHAAAKEGFEFFALDVSDPQDTTEWILASFVSPLVVVPLPPRLPKLAREAMLAQLPAGKCIDRNALPQSSPSTPSAEKSLDKIWAVIFSSGSTGQPKGVALSGEALRNSAVGHETHSHPKNASWLLDLSPAHIGGFSIVARLHFYGGILALGSLKFSASQTMMWVRSKAVQGLSVVPLTLQRLLEEPSQPEDFSSLRLVLLGGAPSPPNLVAEGLARGLPLRLTYGLTETSSQAATQTQADQGLAPLPGVSLRCTEEGEIEVRSPSLASGYYRAGAFEPLPLQKGFFATGDLGHMGSQGLVIDGRRVERINTGGVKVFPAEIENAVLDLPQLQEAAAFGVPDATWGEAVCLAVVGVGLTDRLVREHLAKRLDPRKIPKHISIEPALPRSATGKVLRAELRRQLLDKHPA